MVILMKKITYIFSKGRLNRLHDIEYADDFFYGYRFLEKKNFNTKIIEFSEVSAVFKKIEHILSKLISLPLNICSLLRKENVKIIKDTDNIFLVSEPTAFASLPLLLLFKRKYKFKVHMFVMGLYSKKLNYKTFKFIHNFLISLLISYVDKLYFLGIEEYKIASEKVFDKNKVIYSPFHIDTKFWKSNNYDPLIKDKILFIGNDGNRDYDLLIKIAKKMPEKNFIFVSSNEKVINLQLSNVEIINGNWSSNKIKDSNLKEIYLDARMVILPLKNTSQPSGQSVTLQSMSLGVPVVISKTRGFWDKNLFVNDTNIFFEDKGTVGSWIEKINIIYDNNSKLESVSKSSTELVHQKFNLNLFNEFLLNEVGI